MSKRQLIEIAKNDLAHGRNDTQDQATDIVKVPASNYTDQDRWQQEVSKIFKRLPLMLATTAELPNIGDFKTLDAAGTQVLITRDQDGEARAFVNMCSHRGAKLVGESCGNAHKFTCPYHAWTFSPTGELVAVYSAEAFGEIDRSAYGLTPLPCLEKAGLIWVSLDPHSPLDITVYLSGFDSMLNEFGFKSWYYHSTQRVDGPNWKVAYDGYLDYYHLPILHRDSFGADIGNKANYYFWGPHAHMGRPGTQWESFEDLPDSDWPTED